MHVIPYAATIAAYCNRGDVYRFYEINSEVETLARILNKETLLIKNRRNSSWGIKKSTWVLFSSNPVFMKKAARYAKKWPSDGPKEVIWTDDYSNLMQLLKN